MLCTTWTRADVKEAPIKVDDQKLVTLFGYNWPDITLQSELAKMWGLYSFGVVVGGTTTLTTNMPWNSCLNDISSIIVNAYSIYVYIYRNIETGEAQYAVYASSYAISLIGRCTYIRCGENEVSLEDALLGGDPSLSPGA